MRLHSGIILTRLLYMGGFLAFALHRSPKRFWLAVSIFYAVLVIGHALRTKTSSDSLLLPFASGWLIPLMKIFYWDRWDLAMRIDLLLGLSLSVSLLLALRRFRLDEKFLSRFNSMGPRRRGITIFLACEFFFIISSLVITRRGVRLVGDEPHYLAIAQSIIRDADLDVFNQYYRNQFRDFIDVEKLPAHGTFGRGEKKIYSYHLPGLAFTLAPFLLLKLPLGILYVLIRSYLGLFSALLAVLVYFFSLRIFGRPNLSFFVCSVFTFSAPVFFYSFHIFPEIQATLLLLAALYLLLFPGKRADRSVLLAGLFLGLMLFWGVKYALFVYLYGAGFAAHFVRKRHFRRALLLILFPLACQLLFSGYLLSAYGRISPNAVYYGMLNETQNRDLVDTLLNKITPIMRAETLLDYFFDQRDGLLPYAPFYFFALAGLALALRRFRIYRNRLLFISPALLFILYHAFSTVRAGYCPQARYLVPAVWALMVLAAYFYVEAPNLWLKRLFRYIPLYSLAVTAYQIAQPATLYQPTTHDTLSRPGLMFQQWSNLHIHLPGILPSYIKVDNSDYLPNSVFLVLTLLALAFSLLPLRARSIRWLLVPVFLAAFSLLSLFPRPGLFRPVRIDNPGQMTHFRFQGFGDSFAPHARTESPLLIGTPREATAFVLKWRNSQPGGRAAVRVFLFDRPLGEIISEPGETGTLEFVRPEARRHGGLFLYQFRFVPSAATDRSLRMGIDLYPVKSSGLGPAEDSVRGV